MSPDLLDDNGNNDLSDFVASPMSPAQFVDSLNERGCCDSFYADRTITGLRRCNSSIENYCGCRSAHHFAPEKEDYKILHLTSSQISNVTITTAPDSNVPVFILPYYSLHSSFVLPDIPSADGKHRSRFYSHDFSGSCIIPNADNEPNEDISDLSLTYLRDLYASGHHSSNCSPSLCSSDGDGIPRVDYHTMKPSDSFINFPDMTLPPSHL